MRHLASSGGALSALALHCVENENMGFVLHTGMDPEKPWLNRTVKSRNRAEILSRTGSRYAPASPCEGLRDIEESDSPSVFIGKPCDVAGADMLRKKRPDLDGKLGLALSFCCAGTPSTRGTLELLASMNLTPDRLRELRYRGEGWPGGFTARQRNASEERFVSYRESWGRLTSYVPLRCRLCPDGFGRLSDISCCDAWHAYKNDGETSPGLSIILVRTERGREILHRAMAGNRLNLRRISAQDVLKAQRNLLEKRSELFGRLAAMRLFLIPAPQYPGFSLLRAWLRMPILRKLRSFAGTVRRIVQRRLWRGLPHRAA
jgi:coenzyme F420 hydrogenase subunit beta